jgi:hypothetical protein
MYPDKYTFEKVEEAPVVPTQMSVNEEAEDAEK